MKNLLLLIFALTCFSCTQEAGDLQISLKKVEGNGPFTPGRRILWPLPEKVVGQGVPSSVKEYVIRQFSLHPEQGYFDDYRKGTLSKEKFLAISQRFGIDTTVLSELPTNHQIDILIGTAEKNNERVIIVDANNNEDFSDDEILSYDYPLDIDEQKKIDSSLPVQKVTFEYYNGKEVLKRNVLLKPNPYKGTLGLKLNSSDSTENNYFLFAGTYEHRKGSFLIGEKTYKITAANQFISGDYRDHNTSVFIYPANNNTPDSGNDIPYKVGETINLENKDYEISSISLTGDFVHLKYLKPNVRPAGVTEGLYLPRLKAVTIDYENFMISDYRGSYVLLDFWGTWCKPCIAAIPELKELHEQFKDKGLVLVSVAYDKDVRKVKEFTEKNEMDWIHGFESQNENSPDLLVNQLKVQQFPTTILINPDGKIIARNKSLGDLLTILSKEINGI